MLRSLSIFKFLKPTDKKYSSVIIILQIGHEITEALNFLKHVYSVFGFNFQLCLSTRPDKYLGEIAVWDEAEKVL